MSNVLFLEPSIDGEPRKWLEEILDLEGCESVWTDPQVIILFYFFLLFLFYLKKKYTEQKFILI